MRPLAILMAAMLVSSAAATFAQVVAPPLERRAAELGFSYKWFHRDVTSGQVSEIDWEVAGIYGRYAAWDRLTISAEGGLWTARDDEVGREFSRWAVGGGLSVRVYQRDRWKLLATGTLNEVYDFDDSPFRSDERTVSWTAALLADFALGSGAHRLDLWAGPMFVDDNTSLYAFDSPDPVDIETDPAIGLAVGAYGVLYEYISGFAYVVFADYPQARIGLSIRSRGAQP